MMKENLLTHLVETLNQVEWKQQIDPGFVARLQNAPPITVILPVFNGAQDLNRLLNIEGLMSEADEVLIIDDNSSLKAVDAAMLKACAIWPNVHVIQNRRNLGFVRTVNRGIRQRDQSHDMVVLNSDAYPDRHWLARLRCAAYSLRGVATVSPATNTGGFYSLPVTSKPNPLPNLPIGHCADLLGWIAPALAEQAFVNCGFCWYVRKAALESVGLLDEFLFYRGYGEETDFCMRAAQRDFVNLNSLTSFVGHRGGGAFGNETQILRKQNIDKLMAIWPEFVIKHTQYRKSSVIPELGKMFAAYLDKFDISALMSLQPTEITLTPVAEQAKADRLQIVADQTTQTRLIWNASEAVVPVRQQDAETLRLYLAARLCPQTIAF